MIHPIRAVPRGPTPTDRRRGPGVRAAGEPGRTKEVMQRIVSELCLNNRSGMSDEGAAPGARTPVATRRPFQEGRSQRWSRRGQPVACPTRSQLVARQTRCSVPCAVLSGSQNRP